MRCIFLLSLLAVGCSKDQDTLKDTSQPGPVDTANKDTNSDSDTEDSGPIDTAPPVTNAPVIQTCDAYCEWHDIGDTYWQWTVACTVEDPDGLENIWNGNAIVRQNNNTIVEYLVACDTVGNCRTGFREETNNILCSQAPTYTFVMRVSDWDGNNSKPFSVKGRQK